MKDSTLETIQLNLYKLTRKERVIAEYILEDPIRAIQLTADKIAEETKTSKAAFIRFCQKLGYNGYSEFRFSLSRSLVATVPTDNSNSVSLITQTYNDYISQIPKMINQEQVREVAQLLIDARRLKFLGINRTALSALQLRMRLARLGYDAEVIQDQALMRDIAEYLDEGDVCVIFSIKSLTQSYGQIIPELVSRKVKVILLTMTPNNTFANVVKKMITLPYISKSSSKTFYDDQAIFFIFNEILLNEIARLSQE